MSKADFIWAESQGARDRARADQAERELEKVRDQLARLVVYQKTELADIIAAVITLQRRELGRVAKNGLD